MEYRTLGRTGLRVSELGMGTWQTFDVSGPSAEARCRRVAEAALDHGMNFFDTAPMYGEAERVLGLALEARRGEAFIATKVLERDARSARASIERSLKFLRTGVIDLLQIHNMSGWRAVTPVMQEFQREGRVRFIGITDYRVSNYPEMAEALRTGLYDTIQIPYYVGESTWRRELLPLVKDMDLGVIVMTPVAPLFGRNKLLGPLSRTDLSPLRAFGITTPGQALLKYLLSDPDVSTLIPATSKVERVAENAAVSDGVPLPSEARERIEKIVLG